MPNSRTSWLVATLVSLIALLAVLGAGFVHYPPGVRGPDGAMHRHGAEGTVQCALDRTIAAFGEDDTDYAWRWKHCRSVLEETRTLTAFDLRYFGTFAILAVLLVSVLSFARLHNRRRKRGKLLRGRDYFRGRDARQKLKNAAYKDCREAGSALQFPKGIPFAWDRENRHVMIWGGVGSGKTQIMLNIMEPVIARGDKVLILDTKGDMTAAQTAPFSLLAPQDARSQAWNVAADCTTVQDAWELATKLIPEGTDRIWSDAARTVLTACLAGLQQEKPKTWTWADLKAATISDISGLRQIAADYYPEALNILSEDGGRTTQSVLTTLRSHLHTVSALADAWSEVGPNAFSVTDWLHTESGVPPLILQYDGKYPDLSNAWISGIIAALSGLASSPAFPEDRNRRIWLFLDEFPQLDPLAHFSTLLDTGRSKGICVVLGMQDFAQLRDRYGNHKADAWLGMIGTHIITRMNLGRSAEEACRLIGLQEVESVRKSKTRSDGKVSISETPHLDVRPVVTVSDLSGNLGPRRGKIRALLLGAGKDIYEIDLPIIKRPLLRRASEPAGWTLGKPAKAKPRQGTRMPVLSARDLTRIKLNPDT